MTRETHRGLSSESNRVPELIRFKDHDRRGRWANIVMDDGDPCWIGIAQTGVLVKKSRVGLFGAKLYHATNVYRAARTAQTLDSRLPDKLTPQGMFNPVLVAFVNAVLHCRDLAEVTIILNEANSIDDLSKLTRLWSSCSGGKSRGLRSVARLAESPHRRRCMSNTLGHSRN